MENFKEQLIKERRIILDRLSNNPDYKRLKFIDDYLSTFSGDDKNRDKNFTRATSEDDSFPKKGTYLEQIAHVIKKENRFLHNSEITSFLIKHWDITIDKARRRVSAELSKAKREGLGTFTSYQIGNSKKKVYWGSSKWLDNEGKPLTKHKVEERNEDTKNDLL